MAGSRRLAVYAYDVLFGDAILVEVPDGRRRRFILFDVGNLAIGAGGGDQPLLRAVDDVIARTGGHVDLYVMTHEHLDHVQGLLYAATRGRTLRVDTVWMTASAAPDYYDHHPEAKRKRLALLEAARAFETVLGASAFPAGQETVFDLNALSAAATTADHVEHIRRLTPQPHYLSRSSSVAGLHPFTGARLRILAPEEDASVYYRPVRAHLDLPPAAPAEDPPPAAATGGAPRNEGRGRPADRPLPPRGVDATAFYGLIDRLDGGLAESVLSIDQAGNNTSLVIELTWRGRRLLFAGDAEQESWRLMARHAGLQPVDLLKVSHHGSRTGHPPPDALDRILPPVRRPRAVAILSTLHTERWTTVPDPETIAELEARTRKLYRTDAAGVPPGAPVVVILGPRR